MKENPKIHFQNIHLNVYKKSMSTQDNLANQEKVVVNVRDCVDREKSLCTQGNWCVNTTLFDWCLCFDTGFSCVRPCQEFFFS